MGAKLDAFLKQREDEQNAWPAMTVADLLAGPAKANNGAERPLREREMHRHGSMWSAELAGTVYHIGHRELICAEDGRGVFCERTEWDGQGARYERVEDREVLTAIAAQVEGDRQIAADRDAFANDLAEGDQQLACAIRMHLEYRHGRCSPEAHDGIMFFDVGRNASHDFAVGVLDGKCYIRAVGEDWEEDERGFPKCEVYVSEARPFWEGHYLGHF